MHLEELQESGEDTEASLALLKVAAMHMYAGVCSQSPYVSRLYRRNVTCFSASLNVAGAETVRYPITSLIDVLRTLFYYKDMDSNHELHRQHAAAPRRTAQGAD